MAFRDPSTRAIFGVAGPESDDPNEMCSTCRCCDASAHHRCRHLTSFRVFTAPRSLRRRHRQPPLVFCDVTFSARKWSYLRDRLRRRVREPGFRAHVPARPRCQIIARNDHAIACPVASRRRRRRRGATRGGRVPFVLPAFARRGSRLAVRAAAVPRAVRSRARRRRGARGARAVCPPRRPPRGRGLFRASVQRSLRGASAGDVERLGVGRSRGMEVSGDDGGDRRRRVILLRARAVAAAGLGQGWPFRRQSQPRGPFELRLANENGRRWDTSELRGGYALLYFGFTMCPDICPDELEKMGGVRRRRQREDGAREGPGRTIRSQTAFDPRVRLHRPRARHGGARRRVREGVPPATSRVNRDGGGV